MVQDDAAAVEPVPFRQLVDLFDHFHRRHLGVDGAVVGGDVAGRMHVGDEGGGFGQPVVADVDAAHGVDPGLEGRVPLETGARRRFDDIEQGRLALAFVP